MEDRLVADLHEAGSAGIVEEPGGLRAFFEDNQRRHELLRRFAAFRPEHREEADVDWAAQTRASFPPLLVGERFFLVPPWSEHPTPPGRLRLVINPGMACGTGWHPCTQLCLEALERAVLPGCALLDVGSGSGILSEAARLLGAGSVYACDIDSDAVSNFVGSVDAVRACAIDVIVANISSAVAEDLRAEFLRALRPAGPLIVSGFEIGNEPEGYSGCESLTRDGWSCLICHGNQPY